MQRAPRRLDRILGRLRLRRAPLPPGAVRSRNDKPARSIPGPQSLLTKLRGSMKGRGKEVYQEAQPRSLCMPSNEDSFSSITSEPPLSALMARGSSESTTDAAGTPDTHLTNPSPSTGLHPLETGSLPHCCAKMVIQLFEFLPGNGSLHHPPSHVGPSGELPLVLEVSGNVGLSVTPGQELSVAAAPAAPAPLAATELCECSPMAQLRTYLYKELAYDAPSTAAMDLEAQYPASSPSQSDRREQPSSPVTQLPKRQSKPLKEERNAESLGDACETQLAARPPLPVTGKGGSSLQRSRTLHASRLSLSHPASTKLLGVTAVGSGDGCVRTCQLQLLRGCRSCLRCLGLRVKP